MLKMNFNITPFSYFYTNNHSPVNLSIERQVAKGLDFVLSHFKKDSLWSRNISTKLTSGGQFTVHSRLEALSYFKDSRYLDCRISAYNPESKTVDFIMIDLDRNDFKSRQQLNKAKDETLAKISTTFKIKKVKSIPVIWSGKGYHILVPVNSKGKILEQIPKFKKLVSKNLSRDFLRFAEWYLSSGKCDIKHNTTVSFNNCMLRIPGTFNSKNNRQVLIIQKGDAAEKKVQADLLYGKFLAHLTEQSSQNRKSIKNMSKPHPILSGNGNLSQLSMLQGFYQLRNKST